METNESTSGVNNINQADERAQAVIKRPPGWKSPYGKRQEQEVAPPVPEVPSTLAESFEPLPPSESLFTAEPSTPVEQVDDLEQTQQPINRRGLMFGAVAVGAAATLAVGGYLLGHGPGKNADAAAGQTGSTGQPLDYVPSVAPQNTPTSAAATPEAIAQQNFNIPKISASQGSGDIVIQAFNEVTDGWHDAGIPMKGTLQDHQKLAAMQQQSGKAPDVYAASVSQQAMDAEGNTLFVQGWQSNSNIQNYVQRIVPMNRENIYLSIKTAKDPQEFFWGVERDSLSKPQITITEDAGNEIDATVTYDEINNASQNSAGALDNNLAYHTSQSERLDMKILKVDGSAEISAITLIDLPSQ